MMTDNVRLRYDRSARKWVVGTIDSEHKAYPTNGMLLEILAITLNNRAQKVAKSLLAEGKK